MIADLDETIQNLLTAELPITNGEVEISFEQPRREWSSRLSRPTINLFLYDVRENQTLRQHAWEQVQNGKQGGNGVSHMKRLPFRADCYYMLTTWAAEPEDEHRLLSRAMLVLFRHPILPAERLVGSLKRQPYDIQARLASHDKLTNPAEIWGSLDNEMRPSISYLLTLAFDPWTEVTGPLVRTRVLRSGQSASPEKVARIENNQSDLVVIGGTIWDRAKDGKAVSGISVAIKGTGFFTTTDAQGRFVLGGVPAGNYTLVTWLPDGRPVERAVTLPSVDGNYDLELSK